MNGTRVGLKIMAWTGLALVGVVLLAALFPLGALSQAGPDTMNFQGWLLDNSGNPLGGETRCMRFRISANADGTSQRWPTSGYEYHQVTTESGDALGGLFNVILGSDVPLTPDGLASVSQAYLEIGVSNATSDCDGVGETYTEMTPRSLLSANPFSQRSRRVYAEEATSSNMVQVKNTGSGGVLYAQMYGSDPGKATGQFEASSSTGQTYAVYGRNNSTTDEAAAGYFLATGTSGRTYGVYAQNNSTRHGSSAGYFLAAATSGQTYGVYAECNGTQDWSSAGYFLANATTGHASGIYVENSSTTEGAAAGDFSTVMSVGATIGIRVRNMSESDGALAGSFTTFGGTGKTRGIEVVNSSGDPGAVAGYFYAASGVGVRVESHGGNPIEAYGSGSLDREFYVSNSGEVYADGSFHSGGADVAERIDTADRLQPGDLVEIDPDRPGFFRLARTAFSPLVAGVISTRPGVALNDNDLTDGDGTLPPDDRPLLALMGQVPVMASTENGSIQIGDLLVASATPGHAMRGGLNPAPGTIVGKALEPLESGRGAIRMLVTLR